MDTTPTFNTPDIQLGKETNGSFSNAKFADVQARTQLPIEKQPTFQKDQSSGHNSSIKNIKSPHSRQSKPDNNFVDIIENQKSMPNSFTQTQVNPRYDIEYKSSMRSPGRNSPFQKSMHSSRRTDLGQLSHEAENERLKTTVLVLNQKLNDQNDFEDQI